MNKAIPEKRGRAVARGRVNLGKGTRMGKEKRLVPLRPRGKWRRSRV